MRLAIDKLKVILEKGANDETFKEVGVDKPRAKSSYTKVATEIKNGDYTLAEYADKVYGSKKKVDTPNPIIPKGMRLIDEQEHVNLVTNRIPEDNRIEIAGEMVKIELTHRGKAFSKWTFKK